MSFDFKFDHPNDEVYVAYTIPYTYTQLLSHIRQIRDVAETSPHKFIKFSSIGKSNGGIDLHLLKITNRERTRNILSPPVTKPTVVIIGRQHSGETHSSFIIHGFINYLLSTDPLAFKLREACEFWIVPMANPDGVIAGNYRCNS